MNSTIDTTALFVCIDDFCKMYELAVKHKLLLSGRQRIRKGYLSLSEMLFIQVLYHFSPYKTFKHYYFYGILMANRDMFGKLPSYKRFVKLKEQLFLPLTLMINCMKGEKTDLYFADSTTIKVCRNARISRHKVFKGLAARSKSTMGWFYGFKLHMVINHKGQIMAVHITPGNINDRVPLPNMLRLLRGKCYADKGYISKSLFHKLWHQGIHLITGIRSNMKNYFMPLFDKLFLRKRFLIETVFGVCKGSMDLEHSRHRSVINAFVHQLACLVAYAYKTGSKLLTSLDNLITS